MKKCILLLLLPFLLATSTSAQTIDPLAHLKNPWGYEMRNALKWLDDSPKGVGTNYDLRYHRLEWTVDPAVCYIQGSVTSYFVTTVAGVNTLAFELSASLTVDSVKFHGNHISFTHPADVVNINLGSSLPVGQLDSVQVFYQGNPSAGTGFGSFIQTDHGGTPVVWTLSEPYGARDWWPCKSILSDKIDSIDIIVTTPQAYRVASNGVLVSETLSGPDKIYHWKHRYPIAAYLIAIAVTNYAVYSDFVPLGNDTLEMLNYVYPENLSAFQSGTPLQINVLQLYDSLFGEYPYIREKYGHAQFGWGGGMEHQTMSFVINEGYDLLAHEMAHQWYGDKVTCNSWHDIWVNEGFATYSQGLTLEHLWGGGAWWIPWLKGHIQNITSLPDGSVYCYDTTTVARVFDWRLSYEKGALVLHMLRWIVGDDAFFQGLKDIQTDPLLAYGYAGTEDIKRIFETASGVQLDGFFDDWIYQQGHPVYTLTSLVHPDSSVSVTLQQTPSHASVTFFEMPVPLQFKNASHDTILVFNHSYSGQTFMAMPGFMPDSILFDPDCKLLAVLDTSYLILGQAEMQAGTTRLFPNPAHDRLFIQGLSSPETEISIHLPDGRLVNVINVQAENSWVDLSGLVPGMYYVKFNDAGNIRSGCFVKY